nr:MULTISPECIES: DNA ligase D [Myxococcaceae]
MLARLSTPAEASEAPHVFEVKYDGFRALAALSGGKLAFQSRNAVDLAPRFPALADALSKLRVREAVLDGEIVALDAKGRSRFQLLQNVDTGENLDLRFVAFDLLWLDGEDLRERPLEERRELLESVLGTAKLPLQLSERLDLPLPRALSEARRRGWEGLIAKRVGSPYAGSRSPDWLKLKVIAGQEVVLLGYLPITNGKPQIGALIVGVHAQDGFHEVGKIGTGYTAKTRTELKRLLDKDRVRAPVAVDARAWKDAVWVKPRYVANVNYTEWTEDGRLRHPVFQGLRDDKRPEDVVRERAAPRVKGAAAPRVAAARRTAAPAPAPAADDQGHKRVRRPLAARTANKKAAPGPDSGDDADLLTHPERVLYPADGLTKADVFAHYGRVAPLLVPVLRERPISVQQWPAGIRAPGFFRHQLNGMPAWLPTFTVQHEDKVLEHVDVQSARELHWLANQSALTLHMWSSHRPSLDSPDWVAFDLDPGKGGWESVLAVAARLRELLEVLELSSVPKTSGKRGLHVLVPLAPGASYAETQAFASAVMERLARELPELATTERSIQKRGGRLYLDAMQNARGKTMVAPYSLRAVDGAPFSAPLEWREVNRRLDPQRFRLKTLQRRLDAVGDLFAPALKSRQRLPALDALLQRR